MNYRTLGYVAIAGNALFVLWMVFNGIDEGFRATSLQLFSYIAQAALLNTALIVRGFRRGR